VEGVQASMLNMQIEFKDNFNIFSLETSKIKSFRTFINVKSWV